MRWTDLATWRGPTVNQSGPMQEQRGVIVHIAEGSYEGTISWQKNPAADVSSHFVVDYDGKIAQVVDTDITAWTQAAGNGHWLSIENAGFHTAQLTPEQVESNAQILARAHREYGVPLQLATSPSGKGLGHHGMGGAAWGGHYDCPGPNNVALKPTILARAVEIVGGGSSNREVDMVIVYAPDGGIWLSDGFKRRHIGTPAEVDEYKKAGVKEVKTADLDYWGTEGGSATPGTGPSHEELVQAAFEGAQRAEAE